MRTPFNQFLCCVRDESGCVESGGHVESTAQAVRFFREHGLDFKDATWDDATQTWTIVRPDQDLPQSDKWDILKRLHPLPWYLDTANNSEVCVKDSEGNTVYFDDLGSIPDEMSASQATIIRCRSHALALWMIEMANDENSLKSQNNPCAPLR